MDAPCFKVDIDYELSLFDESYDETATKYVKIVAEFEYIFFLCNRDKSTKFKPHRSYPETYLTYLRSLDFVVPILEPDNSNSLYIYWWGYRHNRELEKHLNSKLTSAAIASQNNWGFSEGVIIQSFNEVIEHISKYPHRKKWMIKHPHNFSGRGQKQFMSDCIDEKILTKYIIGSVLLEPYYERVLDIGTTFEVIDGRIKRQFMVENFIAESGGFAGGIGSNTIDKFKEYILGKYNYSLESLESISSEIAEYYIALGAMSNIQIDSFVYLDQESEESNGGEMKLYPLVEVNYRKTMGYVIQCLADKYPSARMIEFRIASSKSMKKNTGDCCVLYSDPANEWIQLSPEGNSFHSFLKIYN